MTYLDLDHAALTHRLARKYGEDAAQEALLALLVKGTHPNPVAFCIRVARGYLAHEFSRLGRGKRGHLHVLPGDATHDEAQNEARLYGVVDKPQESRLEAREVLAGLHEVDILQGLGYFDPTPEVPRTTAYNVQGNPRKRWEKWRKRRRGARERQGASR